MKKRSFDLEFKRAIVELLLLGKWVRDICSVYDLGSSMVNRWKRELTTADNTVLKLPTTILISPIILLIKTWLNFGKGKGFGNPFINSRSSKCHRIHPNVNQSNKDQRYLYIIGCVLFVPIGLVGVVGVKKVMNAVKEQKLIKQEYGNH